MRPAPALCDTDILSEIIKATDRRVVQRAVAYLDAYSVLSFTSVTAMEILYGLSRKNAQVQVQRALALFEIHDEVLPQKNDYRLAGEISGALDRKGTPIGRIDPLIAACAINRNLPVATGNSRHFGFIVEAGYPLRLEDWRAG